jgi:hypothetical protein
MGGTFRPKPYLFNGLILAQVGGPLLLKLGYYTHKHFADSICSADQQDQSIEFGFSRVSAAWVPCTWARPRFHEAFLMVHPG